MNENIHKMILDRDVEISKLKDRLLATNIENERLTKGLRNVLFQGHNDDCLFCGFKDKIAQETLEQTEGGRG